MTLAGVKCAIGGDAADLLIGWDLVGQHGQHGRIADVAAGELRRADFQCFLINSDVDLAPDAALRATMLARIPLSFALDLDACAVDQKMQRPGDPR